MALTDAQKAAAEQVIQAIKTLSSPRKKRVLADLFLDLVDKQTWADYYQVTSVRPSPCRSIPLNHVQ
jgi:chromatin structure-remodeling complex subunit RSC1/2